MTFHLDEQMSERIIDIGDRLGVIATSVGRLGLKGLGDPSNLLAAARAGRVLVTFDQDYLLLHEAWLVWSGSWDIRSIPVHAGIAVFLSAKGLTPDVIAQALAELNGLFASIENRTFTWRLGAGWGEVA